MLVHKNGKKSYISETAPTHATGCDARNRFSLQNSDANNKSIVRLNVENNTNVFLMYLGNLDV